MSQNINTLKRTQSFTMFDSGVNRVKAIKIKKGFNHTAPKYECNHAYTKEITLTKQETEVNGLDISDVEQNNYVIILSSEKQDSDNRGRASSQSSHTVVEEEEEYEIPVTRSRSLSKKLPSSFTELESRGVSGETEVERNTSSTASTASVKRKSSTITSDSISRPNYTTNKRKTTKTSKAKLTQQQQKPRRRSLASLHPYESLFPLCEHHNTKMKEKTGYSRGRLCSRDVVVTDKALGEGQIGKVYMGYYHGLPVACKTKRRKVTLENYENQVLRELTFAAKLSACKYMNRYVGWFNCPNEDTQQDDITGSPEQSICVVQRYIPNGDSRKYLYQRADSFKPFEVLNATICLFTALRDAHKLNIGIVDLKLENFLIDSAGTGWITDFGSCVEFHDSEVVSLDEMEVTWTTHVASPEMISKREFRKASDVFMATLITAELMTGDLTDAAFQDTVLRREPGGRVNPSCAGLHKKFEAFFTILDTGLRNEPEERPTAEKVLEKLIIIRDTMSLVK